MLSEGDRVPDVELEGMNGETVSPADFRGHKLVLYFYPKDDTSGCTREAIDFTGLIPEFEKLGATVIGCSRDSVAAHDKFKKKHGLGLVLAADEDGGATEAYGVWVEKSMYGRKYMGIERATFLIDGKGRIARIWRKVKVPNHAAEVLAAVREIA